MENSKIDAVNYEALNMLTAQICVINLDGVIEFVNQSWQTFATDNKYLGAGFLGQSYVDICNCAVGAEETMASSFALRLKEVLQGKQSWFAFAYPCHSPDAKRWFKATVQKNDESVIIMHIDITEEYLELEKTSGLLTKAEIVHDLRSPLNAIIGFADLALAIRNAPEKTKQFFEYFEIIRTSGGRMLDVVNDLLDFVSESQSNAVVEETAIDLEKLITEILDQQRPLAKDMNVSMELSETDILPLIGDEKKLWKAMTNLISNGIKYNQQDGELKVFIGTNVSHGIEITVQDTEIGMEDKKLTSMFEPFTRDAKVSGKSGTQGTGIGLAIVREIVHQHDGIIQASSAEGVGSSITLVFPGWRSDLSGKA